MNKQDTTVKATTETTKRTTRTLAEQIKDAQTKAALAKERYLQLEAKKMNSHGHKVEIANNINRKLQAVMDDMKTQKSKLDAMVRKDNPVLYAAQQSRICNLEVKRLELKKALKDCGGKVTKVEKVEKELSMTNLQKLSVSHSKDTITY